MSCYGWEKGEVTLPAGEFSKFKKSLLEKLTLRYERLNSIANDLYNKIKTQKVKDKMEYIYSQLKYEKLSQHEEQIIRSSLMKEQKLVKPKKQDFKLDKEKLCFYDTDLTVVLNKENRSVIYRTDDNNHAIDEARESYLGRTVIDMLERVSYTSHTGGVFRSKTEYDDEHAGSRVTETFGKYKNPKHLRALYQF